MKPDTFYINKQDLQFNIRLLQDFVKDPTDKPASDLTSAYALLSKFTKEKRK